MDNGSSSGPGMAPNPKRVVTSMTSLTLTTVIAVTGLRLLVKSQLSGKHG